MPVKIEFSLDSSANELRAVARLVEYMLDTDDEKQLKLPLRSEQPVENPYVLNAPAEPEPSFDPDDRDTDGLPWDERIHSSGRVKSGDGRWRQRRGVDKAVLATVTAELSGAPTVPAPPPVQATVPAPPPVQATVPAPPPPAPPPVTMTLAQAMPRITAGLAAGKFTQALLREVIAEYGIENGLLGLFERPDLIPAVMAALDV